jgi:hypothetical protein
MTALGTAKITTEQNLFVVRWLNVGSFLRNEPRAFWTDAEAREFCRTHGLRIAA